MSNNNIAMWCTDPFASVTAVISNHTDEPKLTAPAALFSDVSRISNNNTPILNQMKNAQNSSITPTPLKSNTPTFATSFNNNFNTEHALLTTGKGPSSAKQSSDFFDAFHDQFNKNTNGTTSTKPSADPFGLTNDSNANLKNPTASFSAVFDDNLFEDEFAKVNDSKPAAASDFAKFDAFNDNVTAAPVESTNFADFEDSFSSAFTSSSSVRPEGSKFNVPAAANVGVLKNKNDNDASATKSTRYAADYSQGESFSKDLDEVLKRSLVDQ